MQTNQLTWTDILNLPLRIFSMGAVVLLLIGVPVALLGDKLQPVLAEITPPREEWLLLVIAMLVFAVGVGIAAFLWWLTSRFFRLISDDKLSDSALSAIKDLPMGLPEGTVRGVLALIVAVIGIPLLLFSNVLNLNESIAGYINGIVTGVFAFYFGTRVASSGMSAQAVDKLAGAQQQAIAKAEQAAASKADAQNAQDAANTATRDLQQAQTDAHSARTELATARQDVRSARDEATTQAQRVQNVAGFDSTLNTAARHVELARTILQVFGPALPQGILPPQAGDVFNKAQDAVNALRGVTATTATPDQVSQLTQAAADITGAQSPLARLFATATPLLAAAVPIPALGPAAALAALLGLGVKLGSSQFQRWRARVLAAPLAQGLVEFGTVTPQLVQAALRNAPLLQNALQGVPADQANLVLANLLSASDAPQELLAAYGPNGAQHAGLIADENDAARGLEELRHAVLARYAENDVQDATVRDVAGSLAGAAHPDVGAADAQTALSSLNVSDLNRLIDSVAGISARTGGDEQQRAAFDALVTLVDTARRQQIDLGAAIAELHQ